MTVKTDSALEFYKQGKYKEAIDVFSTVLEHDEGNAEVYNNMGLCYAKLNDFEQAEKSYTKSIELNPQIPQAYINLSDLYYKNNDLRLLLCLTSSTNWTCIFLKLKSGKLT